MLSIDDQLAIQTLYATYNQSVDRDRVDATVACFTLRGALVVGESATEGHEELTAFFHARAASQATLPFRNAQHWNANLLLEEIGDAVRGSCYMVRFAIERESGEKQVVSLGVTRTRSSSTRGGGCSLAEPPSRCRSGNSEAPRQIETPPSRRRR